MTLYVVCDYGMGGIWAVVEAESGEALLQRYPALGRVEEHYPSDRHGPFPVFAARPPWMTDELANQLRIDFDQLGAFLRRLGDDG